MNVIVGRGKGPVVVSFDRSLIFCSERRIMRNENVIKVFFVLITIISFLFAFVEQFGLSCFRDGLVISWE